MKKILFVILIWILALSVGTASAAGTVNKLLPIMVNDPVLNLSGAPVVGISYPQWTDAIVLVANTAQTYTFPAEANYILFSASIGVDFYVNYTTTATVPGASTTTGLASELNPTLRNIAGLTSISIISATAGKVTVSLYK